MDLRGDAIEIFKAGVEAVQPEYLLRDALHVANGCLRVAGGSIPLPDAGSVYVLAAGKAAVGMAAAAISMLGPLVAGGVVAVHEPPAAPLPTCLEVYVGGHPVPTAASADAASAALALAQRAGREDLVLCLLSGGASALWSLPLAGVDTEELQDATRQLLASGADIGEINTVRKHLSAIAGGRLAAAAAPARVVTLAISDVAGSPPDVIGSGPTVPDPTTVLDAVGVVERYGVDLPAGASRALYNRGAGPKMETPKPGDTCFRRSHMAVLADNVVALRAASEVARTLGYAPLVLTSRLCGEAREVGRLLGALARGMVEERLPAGSPAAVLLGGETTVTLKGLGVGGRCQEMALAAAREIVGVPGVAVLCAGTDGRDGPTDAAGAVADASTVARGEAAGLSAGACLAANDAYTFLAASGDLIHTGPTGTNVSDLVVLLTG